MTSTSNGSAVTASASTVPLGWEQLAAHVTGLLPPAGDSARVIAVDGFSGAGKTWLADRLALVLGCPVQHVDAFVPGWHALERGIGEISEGLLRPWSQGRAGAVRLYDWDREQQGETVSLAVPGTVVLEGSAIASVAEPGLIHAVLWLETPPHVRRARLDAREDRDAYLPHRALWADQEHALAARGETRRRADLHVVRTSECGVLVTAPGRHPGAADDVPP